MTRIMRMTMMRSAVFHDSVSRPCRPMALWYLPASTGRVLLLQHGNYCVRKFEFHLEQRAQFHPYLTGWAGGDDLPGRPPHPDPHERAGGEVDGVQHAVLLRRRAQGGLPALGAAGVRPSTSVNAVLWFLGAAMSYVLLCQSRLGPQRTSAAFAVWLFTQLLLTRHPMTSQS